MEETVQQSSRPPAADAVDCRLYLPGHRVHVIQVNRSAGNRLHEPEPARVLSIGPDGTVVLEVAGGRRRLWHHDPVRLGAAVADHGDEVSHQPSWDLLRVPRGGGGAAAHFCVVDADGHGRRPCASEVAGGDPLELIGSAGGFLLPATDPTTWVAAPEGGPVGGRGGPS
jgi:hypothetical protein